MAAQLSDKTGIRRPAAGGSRNVHYKVLATLTLVAAATLSLGQDGPKVRGGLANHWAQSGTLPAPSPHPGTARVQASPVPHGTPPPAGSMAYSHPGSQQYLRQSALPRGPAGQPPIPGTSGSTLIEHRFSSGHSVFETTQAMPGRGIVHALRYGNALTGIVERPMKSGYLSRTYVQGGHVLYARVYRRNTFQRFGHAFSYETLVPGIAFGTAYYVWATRPWATPVSYRWGWDAEPWHRSFGSDFTPYENYTSLDEWLTDYMVAQNLRCAYESWQAENAPPAVANATQPAVDRSASESADAGQRPYWDQPDNRRPYWEESPAADTATDTPVQPNSSRRAKKHNSAPRSQTGSHSRPPVEDSPPPLPGPIKAELNAQIKRQLVERQAPATTSDTDDRPDSLKPGHTLFRVNTSLDVPAKGPGQYCSLRANDYIERTGDMDPNGMVPVKVEVGGVSDCAVGLATNVSVNDLEAMESEQQQALTDALLAASKNMGGSRGLPQAPATAPMLLAAGQTRPAPDAMTTLSQLQ